MIDNTDEHEIIGNIGKIVNRIISTVKKNLNSDFNGLMNFDKPF